VAAESFERSLHVLRGVYFRAVGIWLRPYAALRPLRLISRATLVFTRMRDFGK